jgi:hypothetical protein
LTEQYGESGERTAFDRWKVAVGFPPEFPLLKELRFDLGEVSSPAYYEPEDLRERRDKLLDQLLNGSLRVVAPPGHGTTTLARWVVRQVETDCLRMRTIPVLVSLDDLADHDAAQEATNRVTSRGALALVRRPARQIPGFSRSSVYVVIEKDTSKAVRRRRVNDALKVADEITQAAFAEVRARRVMDEMIHAAAARSLVEYRWERVIGNYRYAELVGAERTDESALRSRAADLQPLLRPGTGDVDWKYIAERGAPMLADRAALAQFLAGNRLVLSVSLDLSPTAYGRLAVRELGDPATSRDLETPWFRDFVSERFLTQLKDRNDRSGGLTSSWMSQGADVLTIVPYLTHAIHDHFASTYQQAEDPLDIRAFDPLDVFAVVAAQYPPTATDRYRPELVSAVMAAGVIEYSAQSPNFALTSMLSELDDTLSEWDSFTYHAQWPQYRNLPDQVERLRATMDELEGRVKTLETDSQAGA